MCRPFLLASALAFPLLATGCGTSSGKGKGSDQASAMEDEALRHELVAAGIQPLPDPPPVSDALFELGQALFFDKLLSGNEDVSCATCHVPEFSTGDGRTLSNGVHGIGLGPNRGGGAVIPRNSPPLFALHLKHELFWDGRVRTVGGLVSVPSAVELSDAMRATFAPGLELLAAQAMLPPVSHEEMRGMQGENPLGDLGDGYNSPGGRPDVTTQVWEELTGRLLAMPGYVALFQRAYPGVAFQDLGFAHAGNAIAAFEVRAFARTDSPFERFVRGDDAALTRGQVRGGLAFFGEGCNRCHSGSLFSDEQHHNTGLPQLGPGVAGNAFVLIPGSDIGHENTTGLMTDRFKFRTPSLLDVARTGPYGHAGQYAKLRDFVAHYQDVVVSNQQYDIQSNVFDPDLVTTLVPNSAQVLATLDPLLQAPNDIDVDAIVQFLQALTAEDALDLSDVVPATVPSGLPIF